MSSKKWLKGLNLNVLFLGKYPYSSVSHLESEALSSAA